MRPRGLTKFVMLVISSFALARAGGAQQLRSQSDPRPVAHAAKRTGAITIDGKLSEEAWAAATPIGDLIQSVPDEGKPASQKTEIRILYDDAAIYIGARMYDSLGAKGVRAVLTRRDQLLNGGNPSKSGECDANAAHGYYGIETGAVDRIADFTTANIKRGP